MIWWWKRQTNRNNNRSFTYAHITLPLFLTCFLFHIPYHRHRHKGTQTLPQRLKKEADNWYWSWLDRRQRSGRRFPQQRYHCEISQPGLTSSSSSSSLSSSFLLFVPSCWLLLRLMKKSYVSESLMYSCGCHRHCCSSSRFGHRRNKKWFEKQCFSILNIRLYKVPKINISFKAILFSLSYM